MGKIKITLLVLLALITFSCEKELEVKPISDLSVANFYNNENDFEQAINGVYSSLKSYPSWLLCLSEARSDNMYPVMDGVRDYEYVSQFKATLTSVGYVESAWDGLYIGITRANTVLEQLGNGIITDITVRNRMEGELKFLRGLYHFTLLRLYGGVPVVLKVLSPEEALETQRSPVSEVYTAIISDLEDAISMLPSTPPEIGKATSDAAKGILALVYLTKSGPKHGIEGPGMESNEYSKVIELVNQISVHNWVPVYADIFAYDNENNPDILFDVQFLHNETGYGASYPSSLISERFCRSIGAVWKSGLPDDVEVSKDLYNSYAPEDVRRDFIIHAGYTDGGSIYNFKVAVKFIDLTKIPLSGSNWGINFPVLRYTDVLLMKAEAIIKGGSPGSQADVDEIVNKVRLRAGLEPLTGVSFNQLMDERRKEFAMEGLRWFDLVRTTDIVTYINAWASVEDNFNLMDPMTANYIIYPIPINEMDVKKGLYQQNPGY